MAFAGPALIAGGGVAGSTLKFMGGLRQSEAYKDAAQRAKQAGALAAGQQNRENALLLGRQVTGYANSGVTLEGSPGDVIADSAMRGELASLMKQYEGDLQAYGLKQKAKAVKAEAIGTFAGDLMKIAAGPAGQQLLGPGPAAAAPMSGVGPSTASGKGVEFELGFA